MASPVKDVDLSDWERRTTIDEPRLSELVELYEELGYEVCADPLRPEDMANDCEDCKLLMLLQFKTIYTRRRGTDS